MCHTSLLLLLDDCFPLINSVIVYVKHMPLIYRDV